MTTKKLSEGVELLPVELTVQEQLERGQRLAQLRAELARLEDDFAQVRSQHKADAARVDAEAGRIAEALRRKQEIRHVKVATFALYERGEVVTYRLDTEEEIRTRALRADERQLELGDGSEEPEEGEELEESEDEGDE